MTGHFLPFQWCQSFGQWCRFPCGPECDVKKPDDPRDVAVALAPALRLCGYCKTWHSKPCGEGCYLRPGDPTFEDVCRSAREAIARTPQVSTMTGGFSCPDCGGATHDQMRCTACGFSSLEEEPSNG